jgi:hypothetical protein
VSLYPFTVTTGLKGAGFTVTDKGGELIPFPQEFVSSTEILPETETKLTVIEFVFAPLSIMLPEGNVQEYPMALVMDATEYGMFSAPEQTEA